MENTEQAQSQPVSSAPPPGGRARHAHPKATEMVKITRDQEGIDASHGLRIAVRGGGCSGFEYALDFENEARETDWVYEQGDLKVFVDAVSARYLQGTSIDYVPRHGRARGSSSTTPTPPAPAAAAPRSRSEP